MVRSFLAVLTVFVASAVPARADLLRPFFADFGTCYARHYDKAHMRGHPRQNVTAIYLSNTVQQLAGEDRFVLDFGFVTRDGEHYSAEAYCDTRDRCSLEGDGGTFQVSETGDGLRLDVGEFLGLEGRTGWSGNLAESDDRIFLIFPEPPRACSFD